MGIETEEPIISEESFLHNFTNEGGIDGTTRFLKKYYRDVVTRTVSERVGEGRARLFLSGDSQDGGTGDAFPSFCES